MNRRVEKPKRGIPLTEDGAASEAQVERYLRENHAVIDAQLQVAKASIDRGEVAPLESLPELLTLARKAQKSRR
jgi:hypothetical protein